MLINRGALQLLKLDYSSSDGDGISTANRWNGNNAAYGHGYWQDFYAASSGDNALQVTATNEALLVFSRLPMEQVLDSTNYSNGATGNGTYPVQM